MAPTNNRSWVSSDVPAALVALIAAIVTFFPLDALWQRLTALAVLILLTILFLLLKRRENAWQETALRHLQNSIDNLVRDLRERDRRVADLQRQNEAARPLIIIDYDCRFENTPELPFTIRNVGALPALNIRISSIQFEQHVANFEAVPVLQANASVEVLPDLENQGLVFRNRLRILLDAAFSRTRWQPARELPRAEIERLFDEPVVFPITVSYRGPAGDEYIGNFELVYIYFAAHAFVHLQE